MLVISSSMDTPEVLCRRPSTESTSACAFASLALRVLGMPPMRVTKVE